MYKTGLYGGSFNPLHSGHVKCIIIAASECEELNIVICDGRARNEVDIRIKYRWVYTVTKHLPNIRLHILEDDCPTKEDYGQQLWEADAKKVMQMVGKPIDVVFCGDDYDDNSFYARCYPHSRIVYLKRDSISSTKIRSNPYQYWEWLPQCVRPHYVKKVLLIGGESVGKSTMTINLANYYNTTYIEEAGRELSMKSGTDKMMLMEDYTEILLTHKLNEIKACETANKVLFVDTDCLITRFYLEFLDKNAEGKKENDALADAIAALNQYDLVIFLKPDVEFVQDGTRNVEIEQNREKYSRRIEEIFTEHGVKHISVGGNYRKRFETITELVDQLMC